VGEVRVCGCQSVQNYKCVVVRFVRCGEGMEGFV